MNKAEMVAAAGEGERGAKGSFSMQGRKKERKKNTSKRKKDFDQLWTYSEERRGSGGIKKGKLFPYDRVLCAAGTVKGEGRKEGSMISLSRESRKERESPSSFSAPLSSPPFLWLSASAVSSSHLFSLLCSLFSSSIQSKRGKEEERGELLEAIRSLLFLRSSAVSDPRMDEAIYVFHPRKFPFLLLRFLIFGFGETSSFSSLSVCLSARIFLSLLPNLWVQLLPPSLLSSES